MEDIILWIFLFFILFLVIIIFSVSFYNRKNNSAKILDIKPEGDLVKFCNLTERNIEFTQCDKYDQNENYVFIPLEKTSYGFLFLKEGQTVVMKYTTSDGKEHVHTIRIFKLDFKILFGSYSGIATDSNIVEAQIENMSESNIFVVERTNDGRRFSRLSMSPGDIIKGFLLVPQTTIEIVLASNENDPKYIIKVNKDNNNIIYKPNNAT